VCVASVGASGALFGMVACLVLDLVQNWAIVVQPWRQLLKILGITIISFAFGFIPGVDNFSHIGGFFMGLLAGLVFMPAIHFNKWDRRRKIGMLVVAAVLIVVFYVLVLTTFYSSNSETLCPWCKYFGCLPIGNLCNVGQ
jgi:uncharacterized membrane protein